MIVFSDIPVSPADADRIAAERRETRAAYFRRTNPARVADAWYKRWQYALVGFFVIEAALVWSALTIARGRQDIVNGVLIVSALAVVYLALGTFAAGFDSARQSWIAYQRRKLTEADLRTTDAVAIAKLRAGIDATNARATKLRRWRAAILGVFGSAPVGAAVKMIVDHNPQAEWIYFMRLVHQHPTWATEAMNLAMWSVATMIFTLWYINKELAICISAGADDK